MNTQHYDRVWRIMGHAHLTGPDAVGPYVNAFLQQTIQQVTEQDLHDRQWDWQPEGLAMTPNARALFILANDWDAEHFSSRVESVDEWTIGDALRSIIAKCREWYWRGKNPWRDGQAQAGFATTMETVHHI